MAEQVRETYLIMYTLADVTRMAGAKRRSVQLWAEAGALLAMPGTSREGSGVHRVFDRTEAIIACVLNGLAVQGVPIGRLLTVSLLLRGAVKCGPVADIFEDALANRGLNFLVCFARPKNAADEHLQQSAREVGAAAAVVLLENPVSLFPWSSTRSKVSLNEEMTDARWATTLSIICVNLNVCLAGAKEELNKR